MDRFVCDGSYKEALKEYTESILQKYGTASRAAEREVLYLAKKGNTVAKSAYAEAILYQKIIRKDPHRDAFALYMESAGLKIAENGSFVSASGAAYPLSYWMIARFLVDYKRMPPLKKCEKIPEIEALALEERLSTALSLAAACVSNIRSGGALNLIGRILDEASADEELFNKIKTSVSKLASCDTIEECAGAAEDFFKQAAKEGYAYAANNLAAREADRIIALKEEGADLSSIKPHIESYEEYLKSAADRYESYAANRLGMFYVIGEVKGKKSTANFRDYINTGLAKEYFKKATVYPDANSAWAILNLIQYFHSDYTRNLALLDEHMRLIEKLNPKVYDIAMEI